MVLRDPSDSAPPDPTTMRSKTLDKSTFVHTTKTLEDPCNQTQSPFRLSSGCVWDVCHYVIGVYLISRETSQVVDIDRMKLDSVVGRYQKKLMML